MARKKVREAKAYLVMVYEDGSPTEVILPDGRMALLVPHDDLYFCDAARTFTGVVRKLKAGKVEILSDEEESIEDLKEGMIFDGEDPKAVRSMKLEHHLMISFT
jgi:hypothetical protein